MAAVDQYLVKRDDGLVLLFEPPFDRTPQDPGYIKGYPPGLRENGGQYTHGALWSVIAYAMLGDGNKAGELFSILNPINHANTRAGIHRYKVEPYVACADVYSMPPHVGRGGWTWYTGSAGWMYRAGLEWILGFRLRGKTLTDRSMHPEQMAGFRDCLSIRLDALRNCGRKPTQRQSRSDQRRAGRQAARTTAGANRARRRQCDASSAHYTWLITMSGFFAPTNPERGSIK